jgi:PAS domain S-box-containing protein
MQSAHIPADDDRGSLRESAEARMAADHTQSSKPLSADDAQALIHELQVHQIELEMQNEELKSAKLEAEEIKDRYLDLYDFAPVGYFIFDVQGTIVSANFTGARMLGKDRGSLVGRRFQLFLEEDARTRFSECIREVVEKRRKRTLEVTLERQGRAPVSVQVECVPEGYAGEHMCRAALMDITERKRDEAESREARNLLEKQVQLLQRALITNKPTIVEGYSVSSAYVSAFAEESIGGDFLDFFQTEEGSIGILIGDVSGKGIEAAALAAIARSTIGAFAYEMPSPGEALSHTNRILAARQIEFEQFVTSFLVILDPVSGRLLFSGAGHPPGIICHANESTELLASHGMPLGITSQAQFDQGESCLMPGDRIVVYTDGVVEARSPCLDFFGIEGMLRVLKRGHLYSADELTGMILDAVNDWSRGKLRDDTAVLVVGRNAD